MSSEKTALVLNIFTAVRGCEIPGPGQAGFFTETKLIMHFPSIKKKISEKRSVFDLRPDNGTV